MNSTGSSFGRFRAIVVVGICLSLVSIAPLVTRLSAQTNPIRVGESLRFAATHDGAYTTEYRLAIDNAVVATLPVSALANNEIELGPWVATKGTHVATLIAVGPGGSGSSSPLSFDVLDVPPAPPTNLRIIR